jgi:uncharacterized LabA/DUF88 family protein
MAAYLIVDVDDLILRFQARNMNVDLQELALGLRGGAALAAGLPSPDRLKAIAVANWANHRPSGAGKLAAETVFKLMGYETFQLEDRASIADVLIIHYFSFDPEPIDELILATTSPDLLPLVSRIKRTRTARIRMWGSEDVLKGTPFADEIIFQPLETLLGIKSNNVAVYIDFENIAISLAENGFMLNLEHLIERFVMQARAYGQIVKMAAYAPWGQRGTLPPLVDNNGREIGDEAPARMLMANIDPVYNLPGKNSADLRIARDILTDVTHQEAADIYILVSGDRDFNQVVNTIIQRGKSVVIWGVHGSISRQLTNHPSVTVEYIEDFTELRTHQSLVAQDVPVDTGEDFLPSPWTSLVVQFERLASRQQAHQLLTQELIQQLRLVGVVTTQELGEELVKQCISMSILRPVGSHRVELNPLHPLVEKTRLILDAMVRRVSNTLKVRQWQYVNYGFLLKGLEMERDITRPGMNMDDQWRSHWVDALVRDQVLKRDLIPHRHNPDDLVPVISVPEDLRETVSLLRQDPYGAPTPPPQVDSWVDMTPAKLRDVDSAAYEMAVRIIVSVEQFTSFRNFAWCPLGSLHKRLRAFDRNVSFQRAVEYLEANHVVVVGEYDNPQSSFRTKGISVNTSATFARQVLSWRDDFVRLLTHLYEQNLPIGEAQVREASKGKSWDVSLWFSIMEVENVLNPVPGRVGQYNLFRMHHTVKRVMGDVNE